MHRKRAQTHAKMHTHTHTQRHSGTDTRHYPVVAVDFGHRSIQRLCCIEAVVDVNTTEGLSKLLRINRTTNVLPAKSMHTSHRQTGNQKHRKRASHRHDWEASSFSQTCSQQLCPYQPDVFSTKNVEHGSEISNVNFHLLKDVVFKSPMNHLYRLCAFIFSEGFYCWNFNIIYI